MTHRVVVVGCGNVCALWLPPLAARPDVDLVALVDVDARRARDAAVRHGVSAPVHDDLRAALAAADATVVVDLTPPGSRADVAGAAFAAGCDVIAEKPLAFTARAAGALADAADQHGRRLLATQNHRYHPGMRALRSVVASGDLGDVTLVATDLYRSVEPEGWRATVASPLLSDMAIHGFDQCRYLVAATPTDGLATELAAPVAGFRGAPAALAEFRFADGSAFSYRGSWASPGAHTSWFGAWRVDGSRGTAVWDGDGAVVVTDHEGDRGRTVEGDAVAVGHPGAIDDMLDALAAGRPAATEAREIVGSVAMLEAALRRAAAGGWVALDGSEGAS